MYQYDPETKEFKLRRSRRVWSDAPSEVEPANPAEPEMVAVVPQADDPAEKPSFSGVSPLPSGEADADAGAGQAAVKRVKRRRRAPSPYLPQESETDSSSLIRRLVWVLIFVMLVAWVLMLSPLMNRIKSQERRIFQQDINGSVFPKL